ncbi:MAG: hypothetical protein IRZ00_08770 [Gemmatimonadetes bacterium]|nr:hypothetical protein [Gemmatimonadota bacterium]
MSALHAVLGIFLDRPPLEPQQILIAAAGFGAAFGLLVGAWLRRGKPSVPARRR